MLQHNDKFKKIENSLKRKGIIKDFEEKNGKIKGHMMIDLIKKPKDIKTKSGKNKYAHAFQATFDFYDCAIGIVYDTVNKRAESDLWITPQKENAEAPADEWIEFFIKTLASNIEPDGGFGYPMYTFISDTSDFTVVPTAKPDYVVAHQYSNNHMNALKNDKKCGCFYCLKIFSPSEITEWLEDDNPCDKDGTAICPYCGIDSVIGESSGYSITYDFLEEMNKYWFE